MSYFQNVQKSIYIALLCLFAIIIANPAYAIAGRIGPYQVQVVSQPAKVPFGKAVLLFKVTDQHGNPISGLTIKALTQMPGMPMGEKNESAKPTDIAGEYSAPASFGMVGTYHINLQIIGSLGDSDGWIPISTGEITSWDHQAAHNSIGPLLLIIIAVATVAVVVACIWRLKFYRKFTPSNVIALILVLVALFIGRWFIENDRKSGAIDPIISQTMSMDMLPPPGSFPVTVFSAQSSEINSSQIFPASVLSKATISIAARVSGTLIYMPFYPGDQVSKGQVLAKIDPSALIPVVQSSQANFTASSEASAALVSQIEEDKANVKANQIVIASSQSKITQAQNDESAVKEGLLIAEASKKIAEAKIPEAEEQLKSAQTTLKVDNSQLERDQALFEKGYVSLSALQAMESTVANDKARLQEAISNQVLAANSLKKAIADLKQIQLSAQSQAQAVIQSKQQLKIASTTLKGSLDALEADRARLRESKSIQKSNQAQLHESQVELSYSTITSPVSGKVSQRAITAGSLVTPGSTILTIESSGFIRVQAQVPAAIFRNLAIGTKIQILIPKHKAFTCSLNYIAPTFDSATRLGIIEADVEANKININPGEFVQLKVPTSLTKNQTIVPINCIQYSVGNNQPYVWVVDPQSKSVSRKNVVTDQSDGNFVGITSGIQAGDQIVDSGASELSEGDEVSITGKDQPYTYNSEDQGPSLNSKEKAKSNSPRILILVGKDGFKPSKIHLAANQRTIWFKRTTDDTCATSVIFQGLKLNIPLPLNKLVQIKLPHGKNFDIHYECGMHMFKGEVVAP